MGDTTAKLAYDEATRAIALQASLLDNLRSRAGTLISAAALVTTFLGGQAFAKPSVKDTAIVFQPIETWGWVAIGAFAGTLLLTLYVLWPRKFTMAMSAKVILTDKGDDFDALQAEIAEYHEDNYDLNEKTLGCMFWAFGIAALLLCVEAFAWIVELRGI